MNASRKGPSATKNTYLACVITLAYVFTVLIDEPATRLSRRVKRTSTARNGKLGMLRHKSSPHHGALLSPFAENSVGAQSGQLPEIGPLHRMS